MKKALNAAFEAEDRLRNTKQIDLLVECLARIVRIYITQARIENPFSERYNKLVESASYYGRLAKGFAENSGNEKLLAEAMAAFGLVMEYKGQLTDALSFYQRALDIDKKKGTKFALARNLANKAIAVEKLGRIKESIDLLERATQLLEKHGPKLALLIVDVLTLADFYKKLGYTRKFEEQKMIASELIEKLKWEPYRKHFRAWLGRL